MTQSEIEHPCESVVVDEMLTVAQAGNYLGTGERFVRRLVAERRISYVKLGTYVRLQRSTLDDFIEACRVPATSSMTTGKRDSAPSTSRAPGARVAAWNRTLRGVSHHDQTQRQAEPHAQGGRRLVWRQRADPPPENC